MNASWNLTILSSESFILRAIPIGNMIIHTRQERRSIMPCPLLLTESTSGDNTDTNGFQHPHTIILVNLLALLLCCLACFLRKVNKSWEKIHCTFRGLTFHALHFREGVLKG